MRFESLVNTEGFKTGHKGYVEQYLFESLVNTEGFKTVGSKSYFRSKFESLVNTEGFKTTYLATVKAKGLRVLLIRKDSKLLQ